MNTSWASGRDNYEPKSFPFLNMEMGKSLDTYEKFVPHYYSILYFALNLLQICLFIFDRTVKTYTKKLWARDRKMGQVRVQYVILIFGKLKK